MRRILIWVLILLPICNSTCIIQICNAAKIFWISTIWIQIWILKHNSITSRDHRRLKLASLFFCFKENLFREDRKTCWIYWLWVTYYLPLWLSWYFVNYACCISKKYGILMLHFKVTSKILTVSFEIITDPRNCFS